MKRLGYFIVLALMSLSMVGCGAQKATSYMDMKTQYVGSELDGSITVRSFGRARNAVDSYEQAQKQAVYDVVFSYLTKKDGSLLKPLLLEVNAKDKYETYFDAFFKDGGEYQDYCTMKEKRISSSKWERTNAQSVCETTVCVYRSKLYDKLVNDKIIKK